MNKGIWTAVLMSLLGCSSPGKKKANTVVDALTGYKDLRLHEPLASLPMAASFKINLTDSCRSFKNYTAIPSSGYLNLGGIKLTIVELEFINDTLNIIRLTKQDEFRDFADLMAIYRSELGEPNKAQTKETSLGQVTELEWLNKSMVVTLQAYLDRDIVTYSSTKGEQRRQRRDKPCK